MENKMKQDEIRQIVREQYSKVAENSACGTNQSSCCGTTPTSFEDISKALGYSESELKSVPEGANLGLGCGNPQAIANLKAGETVLDLGSGAGFDCFLAAKQVGEKGMVIGVDMTPTMISKARVNANNGEIHNVEFRLGEIEHLPVADNTVDVIISNCVVNLSPAKDKVFNDCYRVLKNGGRIAISDVVAFGEIPEELKKDMELLTGCMSGASPIEDIKKMLRNAGFRQVRVTPKDESKTFIDQWAPGKNITDYVVSANIEAVKMENTCCSTDPNNKCC